MTLRTKWHLQPSFRCPVAVISRAKHKPELERQKIYRVYHFFSFTVRKVNCLYWGHVIRAGMPIKTSKTS